MSRVKIASCPIVHKLSQNWSNKNENNLSKINLFNVQL